MSFLDHWCHFPQDDLYSLATWGTHPIIKAFTFKKEGREILFGHLNRESRSHCGFSVLAAFTQAGHWGRVVGARGSHTGVREILEMDRGGVVQARRLPSQSL